VPSAGRSEAIAACIRRALGRPVELVVTDNAWTMLRSIPRRHGGVTVRLQRIFLEAADEVIEACARWLRTGSRESGAAIDRYVEEALPRLPRPSLRPDGARGAVYDLEALFGRLNEEHFGGVLDVRVAWGRRAAPRRRRSLRFGCYDAASRTIRIHPALDRADVPEGFVAFVLFHEMLHAALPPRRGSDGLRRHHFREFRERERAYPEYARWTAWERRNFAALLGSSRG
jgi:hypothetical protein